MKNVIVLLMAMVLVLTVAGCSKPAVDHTLSGGNADDGSQAGETDGASSSAFVFDSLDIEMDGKKLSFPFKWTDIQDTVDSYYTEVPAELTYGDEHIGYYWKSRNGCGSQINVNVYNPNPSAPIGVNDSLVCSVYLHTIIDDDSKVDLVLPEGITFGASYEDVIKAYGAPTNESKSDTTVFSTTHKSTDEKYVIELSYKNNVITGCSLKYEF